jgi:hypothetical protein
MTEPLDGIRAIHNAFRTDMAIIDAAAFDLAKGKEVPSGNIERFRFFNEVLVWHAHGEELAIFPRLEEVAPLVAEAYVKDHRGLDSAFEELSSSYAASDPLRIARATAAFRFHLNIHLDKEDAHLYRIFRERINMPEQGKALGVMSSTIPSERFPELVAWLYPLLRPTDQENMTRIWQLVMPPSTFSSVKELIKKAIGGDWAELTQRIPSL